MYVPVELGEIIDFLGWMILTMPDFKTSMTPNGSSELAFDMLRRGLEEFCRSGPAGFCAENAKLAEIARSELDRGDEQASYEALNQMYLNFNVLAHSNPEPTGSP